MENNFLEDREYKKAKKRIKTTNLDDDDDDTARARQPPPLLSTPTSTAWPPTSARSARYVEEKIHARDDDPRVDTHVARETCERAMSAPCGVSRRAIDRGSV